MRGERGNRPPGGGCCVRAPRRRGGRAVVAALVAYLHLRATRPRPLLPTRIPALRCGADRLDVVGVLVRRAGGPSRQTAALGPQPGWRLLVRRFGTAAGVGRP